MTFNQVKEKTNPHGAEVGRAKKGSGNLFVSKSSGVYGEMLKPALTVTLL